MAISDFFTRGSSESVTALSVESGPQQASTKTLSRFLSNLSSRVKPVVLDLGPVVGSNVTFFGEQFGCKIVVEDLCRDIDRHVREQSLETMPEFFENRFVHRDQSVDGILCWDIFDYLDRGAADALAGQLTRMLRPEGMLLAFFNTVELGPNVFRYTKHRVIDQATLERRSYAATCGKRRPVPSRDVDQMFRPLRVVEQFLLRAKFREVLFKKPVEQTPLGSSLSAATH